MVKITDEIRKTKEYSELTEVLKNPKNSRPILVSGLCEGAEISFAVSVCEDFRDRGVLVVMPDEKKASRMANTLTSYGLKAVTYLYRDMLMRNIASSHDPEHERLRTLCSLLNAECDVVVTTSEAMLQFTISPERLEEGSMTVKYDEEYEIEDIISFLERNRYVRTEMVDGVGQYSQRGGILDIFAPGTANPVRMDFFGSSIDTMGYFDIISQRTVEHCEELFLSPCREVIQTPAAEEEIEKIISNRIRYAKIDGVKERLKEELECVKSHRELYCIDKYISVVYPEKSCLLDYCGGMQVLAFDYPTTVQRQKAKDEIELQTVTDLLQKGEISPKNSEFTYGTGKLEEYIFSAPSVLTSNYGASFVGKRFSGIYNFETRQTVSYGGKFDLLIEDIQNYMRASYRVKVICETAQAAGFLAEKFSENDIKAYVEDNREQERATVSCVYGQDIIGFEMPARRYAVLYAAESGIVVRGKEYIRKKTKRDNNLQRIMSYAELDEGDYVVHQVHGVGIYRGLSSLTVDGCIKDYIKIQYAGTDVLYLPCTQLEKISKHIGASSESGTLKLSKMGGTDFAKAKIRAKASAKNIAKELIKLYAERLKRPGFAFPEDDDMQKSFEMDFEYDETDGQLMAIADIKRDMQSTHPMDRLLCGDVGYGKTEVAIRAAFKAAESGKQIAVLVPTTILALQHYRTFVSRMRGYPVTVDMVSRFKSSKQIAESLRKVKRGETDIIIGTHRLLSKDVEFKDLGLLIIDEEQRFGVTHKEKLKQISQNIDCLTLSATPIPRTLNMAISGIRDISILDEAPSDRFPVQSYVAEYDDDIIAEAINKELRRGGQVFYLCNRINKMPRVVEKISSFAPDAVIETANGQMDKDDLSNIWQGLVEGKIDILVSTTIIETGVDVPNANTLIIEDADRMGLSQLHQLRGRVGRSSRRAYAYFTYPKNRELTEISEKRLDAIRDFTEFGAGFRIAMRDMEIRGAGDLLGADQHGHMESIGYDLFMKLLEEAVLEEKGITKTVIPECTIDFNINAYIPEYYIKSSNQRIDTYKKIALIENKKDMMDIYDELMDRFGKIPEVTENLLRVSLLRVLGGKCGFSKLVKKGNEVNFYTADKFDIKKMSVLASFSGGKMSIKLGKEPYVCLKCEKAPLQQIVDIMTKYNSALEEENKN
ncbi:MAG: transcription-repair coupling factor [Ruminococcaceae bacterium]|nr:transcription-repair coupling factor [Oscillospiraceae bacterium]